MTQIAESLTKHLRSDGHQVHKIQLGKGLYGLIPYPKLYIDFIKVILKIDIVHIISASGNALVFKDLPANEVQSLIEPLCISYTSNLPVSSIEPIISQTSIASGGGKTKKRRKKRHRHRKTYSRRKKTKKRKSRRKRKVRNKSKDK